MSFVVALFSFSSSCFSCHDRRCKRSRRNDHALVLFATSDENTGDTRLDNIAILDGLVLVEKDGETKF